MTRGPIDTSLIPNSDSAGPGRDPVAGHTSVEETVAGQPQLSTPGHVFSRMGRNAGWLLSGRGFAGVVSLIYLALAARTLGVSGFGMFSMIIAYGGAFASFIEFSSWKAVLRFGSTHLAEHQPDRLARLLGYTATVDLSGAVLGAVLAALGVAIAAPLFGWNIEQQHGAVLFAAVLLLSTGGTATGMLRLYNRFDLLTYAESIGPSVRLIGALIAWGLGLGVYAMLAVWALAAFAETGAGWIAAYSVRGMRLVVGRKAFALAAKENPRLWRFMVHNSFSGSLGLLWEQAGTLAVGAHGGPAAAGAFRIASKLAGALAKPAETVTRVLYPELARLAASNDRGTLARVSWRTTWIASLLAVIMVILAWFGGPTLLSVISGKEFAFAQPYLVLLSIAAAIDLSGLALEPILNAHGYSGQILAARVLGAIAYVLALVLLLGPIGTAGAAVAAIVSSIVIRGTLLLSARRMMRSEAG
ncbi:lipopolysaccharide biosynthesis protein [Sphingomonas sp.]|uniref:lipopolysaccharide biosynthesis protein n=1 Tax=Sphingomonas sp. TaxID=28214 RepID=UPI00286CF5D3|nr:lipopolysaccharide biosynthesis protein [Sphingomonas sp.]